MYKDLIDRMTLEEKASLCSGLDNWHTKPVERLGIPSIMMADGPHGLRKQPGIGENLGFNISIPSTCFPTASAIASSWDRELVRKVGKAIAEECLKEKVSILLGPGINIKRNPLCGRNFEYYSEDPYLSGQLGAAFINGVQSMGIGTSLKHFAVNNQENMRMYIDAVVDERALREIYLSGFENAVKAAQPWTVMCAYNKLNGTYCSENKKLLTEILKDEWGHDGLVMTDWGACNDRVEGLKAGQVLEMPGGGLDNDRSIVEAVKSGKLSIEVLDGAVEKLLQLIFKASENIKEDYKFDYNAHHELARSAVWDSAVLLKNDNNILPIKGNKKLAVIGQMAKMPRYQGSGSSLINPLRIDNAYDTLKSNNIDFEYADGYSSRDDSVDNNRIKEACDIAKRADIVVIFAGLTVFYESEGFDREHMRLPENQNVLIKKISQVNPNIVVVLSGGSPVEMPWIDSIKGLLNIYLSGQAGGSAVVDLLLGRKNPSGKLAETYPLKCSDCLSTKYFPGGPKTVEYRESIFVGYRYYDTAGLKVLFPFGFGMSYTSFVYSDLRLSNECIDNEESLQVTMKVKNTGEIPGSEIVQLYIHDCDSAVFKAEKELKGFEKVYLEPGEEKEIIFILNSRSFAYYNTSIHNWCVEAGEYEILIGASSRDIRLSKKVNIMSSEEAEVSTSLETAHSYYSLKDHLSGIPEDEFKTIYGSDLPANTKNPAEPFSLNSTLEDVTSTLAGKLLYKYILWYTVGMSGKEKSERADASRNMVRKTTPQNTLRSYVILSGGMVNFGMMDGLLMMMNGKFFRGLFKFLKSMGQRH